MKLFGGRIKSDSNSPGEVPSNWRDETQKFKVIIENIEDGVILFDSKNVIQLFNPAAAKLTGWNVEDATGIDISQVLLIANDKGELFNEASNPIRQVFSSTETIHTKEGFIISRDKKQIPVSMSVSPLLDGNKVVTGAVAVFGDETSQREEERQRADFISTASHEMRTPVASIEGYLALALNDKVSTIDSRARGYLEKAHASTQHLGQLFQDLLTSAQAEDGRINSHPEVIEFGAYLEQLAEDLRFVAEKKGLFVDFVAGTGGETINATKQASGVKVITPIFYVKIDPSRMREVITNLFDNAVKYTPEGRITIGVTGNEKVVQCYIKDTGMGIPAGDIPHLFQKFYRVDNSSTRTIGGTGLGLFICRKIVELYNGRIWAESEVGKGTTFYINLPRVNQTSGNPAQTFAPTNQG